MALPLTLALRLGLRALGRSSGECDCVAWHTCISRGRVKGARWYVEQTVKFQMPCHRGGFGGELVLQPRAI